MAPLPPPEQSLSIPDRYGLANRLLHRFVFRAGFVQEALADAENMAFRRAIDSVELEHPVFISGLPRSGTTTLLNVLVDSGHFASQSYQDMPFALAPLLWNRFSRAFPTDESPRERAHGDGIEISNRSPEAFEEMVWKRFWPDHYRVDRITPWTRADRNEEFDRFLERHMRKVVLVRQTEGSRELRYISKNNMNIARLGALPPALRRSTLLVPFRDPLQHAASMLVQHRRFSALHREDPFAREYMDAIGHHEFGLTLRPVDFGGWLEEAPEPHRLDFWVRYWTAAYQHVLRHDGPPIRLLSYARLTAAPAATLTRLADMLDIPRGRLADLAGGLRSPRTHPVDRGEVSRFVLEHAFETYERLEKRTSGASSE